MVYIHEDGTFTDRDRQLIARLLPHAVLVDPELIRQTMIEQWLVDRPATRRYRQEKSSVFAIKLMDPYFVGNTNGVLVLDTDVLWFKHPHELLDHIVNYQAPVFWDARGKKPLRFKNGEWRKEDLSSLNTGVVYYQKRDFNLEILGEFCQKLDLTYN